MIIHNKFSKKKRLDKKFKFNFILFISLNNLKKNT